MKLTRIIILAVLTCLSINASNALAEDPPKVQVTVKKGVRELAPVNATVTPVPGNPNAWVVVADVRAGNGNQWACVELLLIRANGAKKLGYGIYGKVIKKTRGNVEVDIATGPVTGFNNFRPAVAKTWNRIKTVARFEAGQGASGSVRVNSKVNGRRVPPVVQANVGKNDVVRLSNKGAAANPRVPAAAAPAPKWSVTSHHIFKFNNKCKENSYYEIVPYSNGLTLGSPDDDADIGSEGECAADINGDGYINTADFAFFLNLFAAGDDRADLNEDDEITTQDFIIFLNQFASGCGDS